MNTTLGSYEWRSDTHPVQEVQHWMNVAKQYQAEIAELREHLTERADFKAQSLEFLSAQLAASQAREKVLREALIDVQWEEDGYVTRVREALSTPSDDSALRSYVANEMRSIPKTDNASWYDVKKYADRYEKGLV